MDGDQESLLSEIEQFISTLTDPRIINIQTTLKGSLYFLMDKTNLNLMLKPIGNSAMQLIDQFGSYPSFIYSGPNDNPRAGWTDDDGVKRAAPPTDKPSAAPKGGKAPKQLMLSVLTTLANYYVQLLNLLARASSDANKALLTKAVKTVLDLIRQLSAKQITENQAVAGLTKVQQSLE
jgi:hypothetical protein